MSSSSLQEMPKGLPMVACVSEKSKSTDFRQICIDGSLPEVLQFLTDWRKTAEHEGTPFSSPEAYRPYDGFVDALRHGRLDVVKALMGEGEGLSVQSDGYCHFAADAAKGAVKTASPELLDFLLAQGWNPVQESLPSPAGTSYRSSTIS
jgi:hypothetical protein